MYLLLTAGRAELAQDVAVFIAGEKRLIGKEECHWFCLSFIIENMPAKSNKRFRFLKQVQDRFPKLSESKHNSLSSKCAPSHRLHSTPRLGQSHILPGPYHSRKAPQLYFILSESQRVSKAEEPFDILFVETKPKTSPTETQHSLGRSSRQPWGFTPLSASHRA